MRNILFMRNKATKKQGRIIQGTLASITQTQLISIEMEKVRLDNSRVGQSEILKDSAIRDRNAITWDGVRAERGFLVGCQIDFLTEILEYLSNRERFAFFTDIF